MRLQIRVSKPVKKTLPIDISDVDNRSPQLRDLIPRVTNGFGFQFQDREEEEVRFSLNNKDILQDDLPMPELGIVNGDLLYVHLPASYIDRHVPIQPVQPSTSKQSTPSNKRSASSDPDPVEASCSTGGNTTEKTDNLEHIPHNAENEQPMDLSSCVDAADYEAVQEVQELSDHEVNQYLRGAMLIRDIEGDEIPHSLQTVLDILHPSTPHQAVFSVLHVLVLETGFVLQNNGEGVSPALWENPSHYKLDYTYQIQDQPSFSLVAVPMANTLLVHAVSRDGSVRYNLTLKPQNYSTVSEQELKFQRLPQLSREVKDKLTYPMLQNLAGDTNCLVPSLENILYEVKIVILKHLNAPSLLQLSRTCSVFHMLYKSPQLWHRLFIKDFGKRKAKDKDKDPNADWFQLYKEQYLLRKRIHEQMRRAHVMVPPFIGRPFPLIPRAPWAPPFIIGGDYDRMPGGPQFPGMGGFLPQRPRFDPIGPLPDNLHAPGRAGIFPMAPRFNRHRGGPRFGGGFGPMFF